MKIVLIAQQGTGTNLLRSFLNSHNEVYIADELFVSRTDLTGTFQEYKIASVDNENIKQFLDEFYDRKEKVVGFDLKYNQINKNILEYLNDKEIKVIHLLRDKGRTFLKQLQNIEQTFSYLDLIKYCEWTGEKEEYIYNRFKGNNYLEITYEDMTRGRKIASLPIDFEHKLLEFLQVEYQKLGLNNFMLTSKNNVRFD